MKIVCVSTCETIDNPSTHKAIPFFDVFQYYHPFKKKTTTHVIPHLPRTPRGGFSRDSSLPSLIRPRVLAHNITVVGEKPLMRCRYTYIRSRLEIKSPVIKQNTCTAADLIKISRSGTCAIVSSIKKWSVATPIRQLSRPSDHLIGRAECVYMVQSFRNWGRFRRVYGRRDVTATPTPAGFPLVFSRFNINYNGGARKYVVLFNHLDELREEAVPFSVNMCTNDGRRLFF